MRRVLLTLLALALVPALAHAGPKKPKELLLQPLVDEMKDGDTPLTKGQEIAAKRAEACLKQDMNWVRGQQNDVPINQLYESLGSAVVCWQGAEKKTASFGEEAAPVHWWTAGRARYIESFRSWVWALDAKQSGDTRHVCKRLQSASAEGVAALDAAEGLADKYQGASAKALAYQLETDGKSLGEAISGEIKNQRCNK